MKIYHYDFRVYCLAIFLGVAQSHADAANVGAHFATGAQAVSEFGVYEVALTAAGTAENPFDTRVTVTFTPPSGAQQAQSVAAFFDGGKVWRARVYVSEVGEWTWRSTCEADRGMDAQSGSFRAVKSKLRGRLLPHPQNPHQWITEDGRWFLNLNDTAYFLLCAHDGNGNAVTDEVAARYVRDDVAHGITSVRCSLTCSSEGFQENTSVWRRWFFSDDRNDHLRLDHLQCTDRRLRMLLETFPDVAVQLILFPLAGYHQDDRFWPTLHPVQRERLLRQLIARYAAYPQIFWLITNDAHYGDAFPVNNAIARETGAWLMKNDPWQHPRSTGHARRVPFFFGQEEWATYLHLEHQHDLGALEAARYQACAKPVFLGEDRYEQDHGPRLDPTFMRAWQRRLFWAWLLSGGAANYGGRWWSVQPYSETGTQPSTYAKRPKTTFTRALVGLDSVKVIRDYFEQRQIDLGAFTPDHARAGDPGSARSPRVMRRQRAEFLIYHPNAAADGQNAHPDATQTARIRLDLRDAPGTFAVEWCRADDGMALAGNDIQGGREVDFTAPWPGQDVILRLTSQSKDAAGKAAR